MDSNHTNPHGFNTLHKEKDNFNPADVIVRKQKRIAQDRAEATPTTLLDEITALSSKANKALILPIRNLYPSAAYEEAKKVKVPCYFPSMDFEGNQNFVGCLDIDRKANPRLNWDKTKEILSYLPWVMICAYSLSGEGLFILFRYGAGKNHKQAIRAGGAELLLFGIEFDDLKELNRIRAQSYDPAPYINWGAELFDFEEVEETIKEHIFSNDKYDLSSLSMDPATAFNNAGLAGLELVNELLTEAGYTITAGKNPTIYEYQRAGGSLKSLVAFYNKEVVLFQIFSPNTGLLKTEYNLYELFKELNNYKDYEAQKELAAAGFGEFNESSKNEFPIDVLPQIFKEYAVDLRDSLNFPIDYTGTAILTAVSTAIGTNVKLSVKSGWSEYGSLYVALIGNAGANKTHPINTVFKPIRNKDKERHLDYETAYSFYIAYEKLSKKEKESEEPIFCPKLEKSILSNFTPEVLNKRLEENPRGCTVVADELAPWFDNMNNYSKGDQIGVYLSFWSNQPTTIDRIGNAIPLFISNPYLSIIGGLQPRVLNTAFPPNKLNNGFFQRFLFAYPDEALKSPINDNEANAKLSKKYQRYIEDCFTQLTDRVLVFTPEAKEFFYRWQSDNCDKVNEHQNSIKGEVLSKYDNHFLRLALLLQMMHDPEAEAVELKAVEGAKLLCDYYLKCAFKVLAKIQNAENYLLSITPDKQALFNGLDNEFTTAQAVEAGEVLKLKERAVKRFLTDTQLFKKVKYGMYEKIKLENK